MKKIWSYLIVMLLATVTAKQLKAQTILKAVGSDTTYELINAALAPGYNVIEVPDCGHTTFGKHIEEVYDADLETYVFKFIAHRDEDDDRCKNFDRQRTEIKTYDKSPENLKANLGEKIRYTWKFKLDEGFQPSSKFTHLHQLKSVDGPDDNMPMITLTARDGSTDKLELRYAAAQTQSTVTEINLSELLGEWVEVVEDVTYEVQGKAMYHITMTRLSDGKVVMDYENNTIAMWKVDASFIRPKWGIYRSLDDSSKLRDEAVYFDDFKIEELDNTASVKAFHDSEFIIYPNPTSNILRIDRNIKKAKYYAIFDVNGREVIATTGLRKKIDVSALEEGKYFITLYTLDSTRLGSAVFLKR